MSYRDLVNDKKIRCWLKTVAKLFGEKYLTKFAREFPKTYKSVVKHVVRARIAQNIIGNMFDEVPTHVYFKDLYAIVVADFYDDYSDYSIEDSVAIPSKIRVKLGEIREKLVEENPWYFK
jgi:hypothetical protein